MKTFSYFVLFLLCSTIVLAAPGQNAGVDPIFKELGMEKPLQWSTWTQQQKHSYLRSLGVYPESGSKYQGRIGDLSAYFAKLGLEQPLNWNELSFEQKQSYIAGEPINQPKINEPAVIAGHRKNSNNISYYILVVLGVIIGLFSFLRPKNSLKKDVGSFIYFVLPFFLALVSYFLMHKWIFNLMGSIAEYLLIFLLFVKPVALIFKIKFLYPVISYRRQLGVASFWFFFFHAAGLMYIMDLWNFQAFYEPYMYLGLAAGIGMLLLSVTSNDKSVRYFRRNWKRLQYVAYPVLFGTLAHTSLATYGDLNKFWIVSIPYALLKLFELAPWAKRYKE